MKLIKEFIGTALLLPYLLCILIMMPFDILQAALTATGIRLSEDQSQTWKQIFTASRLIK